MPWQPPCSGPSCGHQMQADTCPQAVISCCAHFCRYSLEQEYYWVSRDDLVQHFDDIFEDQDCQLPTDDLLID